MEGTSGLDLPRCLPPTQIQILLKLSPYLLASIMELDLPRKVSPLAMSSPLQITNAIPIRDKSTPGLSFRCSTTIPLETASRFSLAVTTPMPTPSGMPAISFSWPGFATSTAWAASMRPSMTALPATTLKATCSATLRARPAASLATASTMETCQSVCSATSCV